MNDESSINHCNDGEEVRGQYSNSLPTSAVGVPFRVIERDALPLAERSDEELMLAHAKGLDAAFSEILRRHHKPVLNYVNRMVQNYHIAEELTQEVFMALVKNAQRYVPTAKFTTYMYTIASNIVSKEWARRKRRSRLFCILSYFGHSKEKGEEFDPVERAADPQPDAGMVLERTEIAAAVDRALKKLPKHQREAFVLRRLQDVPYEEIANIMNTPIGTVKSRVVRAEHALRPLLSAYREYV